MSSRSGFGGLQTLLAELSISFPSAFDTPVRWAANGCSIDNVGGIAGTPERHVPREHERLGVPDL
jgi:hypothetical protein